MNEGIEGEVRGTEKAEAPGEPKAETGEGAEERVRRLEGVLKELGAAVGAQEMEGIGEKVKEALGRAREDRAMAEEMLVGGRFKELVAERGVVDADAAGRLIDMSGVKVDVEKRSVEGLEEAMDRMLGERPWLVGRSVAGGTPGGGTPRTSRGASEEETLAGRVRQEFARRLPSGMSVPGAGMGNMRIS